MAAHTQEQVTFWTRVDCSDLNSELAHVSLVSCHWEKEATADLKNSCSLGQTGNIGRNNRRHVVAGKLLLKRQRMPLQDCDAYQLATRWCYRANMAKNKKRRFLAWDHQKFVFLLILTGSCTYIRFLFILYFYLSLYQMWM